LKGKGSALIKKNWERGYSLSKRKIERTTEKNPRTRC